MPRILADIAWAAGLFEGEGWAYVDRSTPGSRPGPGWQPQPRPVLGLAMTDEDTVIRFQAIVGVGAVRKTTPKDHRKPYWTWLVRAKPDVLQVAGLFLQWASARRGEELLRVVDACKPLDGWETRRARYGPKGHA